MDKTWLILLSQENQVGSTYQMTCMLSPFPFPSLVRLPPPPAWLLSFSHQFTQRKRHLSKDPICSSQPLPLSQDAAHRWAVRRNMFLSKNFCHGFVYRPAAGLAFIKKKKGKTPRAWMQGQSHWKTMPSDKIFPPRRQLVPASFIPLWGFPCNKWCVTGCSFGNGGV